MARVRRYRLAPKIRQATGAAFRNLSMSQRHGPSPVRLHTINTPPHGALWRAPRRLVEDSLQPVREAVPAPCVQRQGLTRGSFRAQTLAQLSPDDQASLDALLQPAPDEGDSQREARSEMPRALWHTLRSEPGRTSLDAMLEEIAKLVQLRVLELPPELFAGVPRRVLMYTVLNHELTEFLNFFPNYTRGRLA